MLDWRIGSARVTLFVSPGSTVSTALWRELTGDEPETSVIQRTTSVRNETGPWGEGKLAVVTQPMRTDLIYDPVESPTSPTLQLMGAFPASAEPFFSIVRAWVRSPAFPAVQRIAIGLDLSCATPDRLSGYDALREYIDTVPKSRDATDFTYQVNWPRSSRVAQSDLVVNRLARWSVKTVQRLLFTPGTELAPTPVEYFANLVLDINTVPTGSVIPPFQLVPIFDDLVEGAREIAAHGEHF